MRRSAAGDRESEALLRKASLAAHESAAESAKADGEQERRCRHKQA